PSSPSLHSKITFDRVVAATRKPPCRVATPWPCRLLPTPLVGRDGRGRPPSSLFARGQRPARRGRHHLQPSGSARPVHGTTVPVHRAGRVDRRNENRGRADRRSPIGIGLGRSE